MKPQRILPLAKRLHKNTHIYGVMFSKFFVCYVAHAHTVSNPCLCYKNNSNMKKSYIKPFSLIVVSKLVTNRNIVCAVFMYPLDDSNGNFVLQTATLHWLRAAYGNL